MIKTFNFDYIPDEFCSNTYIVGELNEPCVIIDYGSTSKKLIEYIKSQYSEVKAVLITHGHFDHIRGLNLFNKFFPNTPIYTDRYDKELLKDAKLNSSNLTGEKVVINLSIKTFKDNEILNFGKGLNFKVYETPYHTDGSVCFLNEEEHALFTGDSLFKGSIGRADLITSNRSLIASSLETIKEFDKNLIVYPGHGEITSIEKELINNQYLK